jgi:hypothetical protein
MPTHTSDCGADEYVEICKQTAIGGVMAYRVMAYGFAVNGNASVRLHFLRARQIMQSHFCGGYIDEVIASVVTASVFAVIDIASGRLHFISSPLSMFALVEVAVTWVAPL